MKNTLDQSLEDFLVSFHSLPHLQISGIGNEAHDETAIRQNDAVKVVLRWNAVGRPWLSTVASPRPGMRLNRAPQIHNTHRRRLRSLLVFIIISHLIKTYCGKAMSSYCTTNTIPSTDSATPLRRARHNRTFPALSHSRQAGRGDRYRTQADRQDTHASPPAKFPRRSCTGHVEQYACCRIASSRRRVLRASSTRSHRRTAPTSQVSLLCHRLSSK